MKSKKGDQGDGGKKTKADAHVQVEKSVIKITPRNDDFGTVCLKCCDVQDIKRICKRDVELVVSRR